MILAKIKAVREGVGLQASLWAFASACRNVGLCGVEHPFWEGLDIDICEVLSQDLLHAYHKFR
jgi:hypothetical protein